MVVDTFFLIYGRSYQEIRLFIVAVKMLHFSARLLSILLVRQLMHALLLLSFLEDFAIL